MVGDDQVMAEHANTGDDGSLVAPVVMAINDSTFTGVQSRVHNRVEASYGHADQRHGEGGLRRDRREPGADYRIRLCGSAVGPERSDSYNNGIQFPDVWSG
jgi:hypothetical protein